MAVNIEVPSAGESVTEGILARWLKPNGAFVQANEVVCELETDKASLEVRAPASGTLTITVAEGQKVAVGAVLGHIEAGAAPTSTQEKAQPGRDGHRPALPVAASGSLAGVTQPGHPRSGSGPVVATPRPGGPVASPPGEVRLGPAARHLATDKGVDVSQLVGTGRGGRVTKEDILSHLQRPPAPAAQPAPVLEPPAAPSPLLVKEGEGAPAPAQVRETRQRMSPIRQRIAERLLSAQQNAAILTTFNEADLSAIMALRTRYKETFQKKHGVGLGFMSFFVKACVEALRVFPVVQARIDGNDIVYPHYYHFGVAVSTDKGLMVPVLRDVDQLTFAQIEQGIADLAQRARDGKIAVTDLQGGTFTITNGGIFGSLLSTPILNPPQSGILGMHTIQKRPVVVDDQIVIRPMMYLALSYDHRLIDGREAVGFLVRVKECIESPERLLLEV
jgi:2-oxoglutarate dehydrogenase E2 component (dihydrolipoamide succinyltransferase)